jgi:hypothetical protein
MAVRELSSSPSMAVLYPKALVGTIRRLPGVPGAPSGDLPDTELVLPDVVIDREHLAEYDRVCTFEIGDEVPATYPHLLVFPLAMQIMTGGSFPFPVVGLVHVGNRIEQVRPILASERLAVSVRTENLREHDRGTQFDIAARASSGGEVVWRSTSTYLHREEGGGSKDGKKDSPDPPEPTAELSVPDDVGRRYAAVSGDRNPIHLHPLAARLFGMPRMIAHGMWLKARCLALLAALPESYVVEVGFKLPVLLPAKLAFSRDDGGFALHDAKSGKPHLEGRIG